MSTRTRRLYPVTTPQEVALADVRKSISFCRTVKMEIFGLIENMSGFACPHKKIKAKAGVDVIEGTHPYKPDNIFA